MSTAVGRCPGAPPRRRAEPQDRPNGPVLSGTLKLVVVSKAPERTRSEASGARSSSARRLDSIPQRLPTTFLDPRSEPPTVYTEVVSIRLAPFGPHPLQKISADPVVRAASFDHTLGAFSIPGRTAAVFWANRPTTEQIQLLIQDVNNLVASGALSSGRGNALTAKLDAALHQAQKGNSIPAANQLAAFVTQVTVFASQGFLPQDAAQALTANAALAIAGLAMP